MKNKTSRASGWLTWICLSLALGTGLTSATTAHPLMAAERAHLPQNKQLHLYNIDNVAEAENRFEDRTDWEVIHYDAPLNAAVVERIARCANLRRLSLVNLERWGRQLHPLLTVDEISPLFDLRQLEHLSIGNYLQEMDNAAFDRLAEAFRELTSLEVWGVAGTLNVTGVGFESLAKMPKLARLQYSGVIDGPVLAAFAQYAPKLEYLNLRGSWRAGTFDAEDLTVLADLEKLADLSLPAAPDLDDDTLAALVDSCPNLTRLSLGGVGDITNRGFARLADLRHLTALTLTGVEDENLAALGTLTGLTSLQLYDGNATDRGLAHLANLTNLRELRIGSFHDGILDITDDGVVALAAALPKLERLGLLCSTGPGDRSLAALAKHPNLQQLELDGLGITPEGEAAYRRQKTRGWLSTRKIQPTPRPAIRIPRHAAGIARVLEVDRDRVVSITATDRAALERALDNNEGWLAIRCEATTLDDTWMTAIAENRELIAFSNTSLNPTGLTSAGVGLLGQCPKLRMLAICTANAIGENDWVAVAKGCPELEILHACDTGASQTGAAFFDALSHCVNMKHLYLRGMPAGAEEAFFACLDNMPDLKSVAFQDRVVLSGEAVKRFKDTRPDVSLRYRLPDGYVPPTPTPLTDHEPEEVF